MSSCAGDNYPRVLVVDDDPGLLDLMEMRLGAAGYDVMRAESGIQALERFRALRPRVVISDLRMDGMDGHALFDRLHAEAPTIPVIILTAHGTIPDAVAATQKGVYGFLTKPFDGRELLAKVAQALQVSPALDASLSADAAWRADIISSSLEMDEVLRQARRVADQQGPVLISGPRGTGKQLLARAIHAASDRAQHPLVTLRCGETNALGQALEGLAAALEAARGGALLLTDVEELTAADQARLLLHLRRQSLPPMMAPQADIDVRILAATTQPLNQAIRDGRFSADLFYALGQVSLTVPALADRRSDIPALVALFTSKAPGPGEGFSPDGIAALQAASWPGNVGQLRSVVEQALSMSVTARVPETLVRRLLQEKSESELAALNEARRVFEYEYLVHLLETTRGNITHAARIAQRNRTEFYKLLARHEIDPVRFK